MILESFFGFGPILLSYLMKNDPEGFTDKVSTIGVDDLLSSYDFVIIGAGSAGSVVANRLSENSEWNVLLVEAGNQETDYSETPGSFPTLVSSPYNWNYTTAPGTKPCTDTGELCPYPRGRSLGGSSAMNGMVFLRGYKLDYDRWGQDNPGWSFDDVHPYFLKSQDNRIEGIQDKGTEGPLTVTLNNYKTEIRDIIMEAGREIGMKDEECMNYEQDCIEYTPVSIRDGRRCSSARAYLEPVAGKRENLHILPDAFVYRIETEGNKATGIEIMMNNGEKSYARASREIILSAGAIDSPKILMLSGIGPKDHLESLGIDVVIDLPVGSYLQDHGYTNIQYSVSSKTINAKDFENSMGEYVESQTGPLSSTGVEISAYSTLGQPGPPLVHFLIQTTIDSQINQIAVLSTIMRPYSSGTVRLSSADPHAMQLIDVNYLGDQRDYDLQMAGLKEGFRWIQAPAMKAMNATPIPTDLCTDVEKIDEYLACKLSMSSEHGHPIGTAKMSPREKGGVVDHKLKVYGMENLRVIDASIAPYVVSVNSNAMAIMIGEKGADLVKQDHSAL